MCITVFYIQHAECAADIILSFNSFRTTPVRDIGQSVLAWMCIPYKKRDFSVSGTCVPCRKIPSGLLLYSFITSRKSEVFPSRIPENPFPVH